MEQINPIFDRSKQVDEIKDVHFQALSWHSTDVDVSESEEEQLQYEIYISGVNKIGNSVTLRVTGFTPYFYIIVPDSWRTNEAEKFFKHFKEKLKKRIKENNKWSEYPGDSYGLVDYELLQLKKLFPYTIRKFQFIKLIFSSDKAFGKCKWMFSEKNQTERPIKISGVDNPDFYEAFETNVNHLNRFCHIKEIETTGWIIVKKFTEELDYSTCQINVTADWNDVFPDPDTKMIAPLTIFSWDIECLPENTEEFPNPNIEGDVIKQISVVLIKYGTKTVQKFIFTSSPCSPIEDSVIVEGTSEKHLLENFCAFIKLTDPDMLTGYNIWGFDDNYLWTRMFGVQHQFLDDEERKKLIGKKLHKGYEIDASCLSRLSNEQPKFERKELSSSAYGNNEFKYISYPGRQIFDLLVAIRRDHKLDGYSLNAVSKEFLKEHKVDLPYRELFKKLNGGPDDIAECAVYCIQDSNLVVRLLIKLSIIPNFVEMAKATFVPMEWLLFRGQQCKSFSLLAREAAKYGFVIPTMPKNEAEFKGATVINPLVGMYYDPIAGLDFASLYPSIMMAYNMCYTTFINTPEMLEYVKANGIPYKTIEWDEEVEIEGEIDTSKKLGIRLDKFFKTNDPVTGKEITAAKIHYSCSFVQIEDDNGVELSGGIRGLLGIILKALMLGRKATKKLMKDEKDQFVWAVLNGKQLAQKVTMNSLYGFTGAGNGMLPLKEIAAAVTAIGRQTIDKTSKLAGEEFGAITVYGDSIPPNELITVSVKEPGKSKLHMCLSGKDIPVQEFADSCTEPWEEYRGFKYGDITVMNKEYKNLETANYYTYTHQGYQQIKKVIKHKTNKKLYHVKARDANGIIHEVTVTEGHSLILEGGKKVSADKLNVGDILYDYVKSI